MAHAQQQILEAVRAALAAAGTDAGPRVFLDRPHPLTQAELPAILVEEAPQGEAVAPDTVNGSEQRRFGVLVTAVVKGSVPAAAAASRELGLQVERVLGVRTFACPKPGRLRLAASRINTHGDGSEPMAAREQVWNSTYFVTRRDQPDQPS